jgi:replicative superfamily II helicase
MYYFGGCVACRFALLGLSTVELTGDSDPDPKTLELADIICTTPEKLGR